MKWNNYKIEQTCDVTSDFPVVLSSVTVSDCSCSPLTPLESSFSDAFDKEIQSLTIFQLIFTYPLPTYQNWDFTSTYQFFYILFHTINMN